MRNSRDQTRRHLSLALSPMRRPGMWARSSRVVRMVCLGALFLLPPGRVEAGRVRGTVVDREGKPAAGATVWTAKLGFMEPLESREATADASGTFAIEAGPGHWAVFALRGDEGGRAGWESIAAGRGRQGPRAGHGPARAAHQVQRPPARRRDGRADRWGSVRPGRRSTTRARRPRSLRDTRAGDDEPRGLPALPRLRAQAHPL